MNQTEQARLRKAVNSDRIIVFSEDIPDREHPTIKWAIYGDPETCEVIVKVTAGEFQLFRAERSPLAYPHMADRVFGIDVADKELASRLSLDIWEEYASQLIDAARR